MAESGEKTNVFQFMVVRSPTAIEPRAALESLIEDDALGAAGLHAADLFSMESTSLIGRTVYQKVFCDDAPVAMHALPASTTGAGLYETLIATLDVFDATCPGPIRVGMLEAMGNRTTLALDTRFYLFPERLTDLKTPLVWILPDVLHVLRAPPLTAAGLLDRAALANALRALFAKRPLADVVFVASKGVRTEEMVAARRELFDTLYLLYIMRRVASVNLANIIDGLRALHVVEALAVDEVVESVEVAAAATPEQETLLGALATRHPGLKRWGYKRMPPGLPLIATRADLATYLSATPIIHPLFARLHRFRRPFNAIRPIGIGDLKVVKQWLCGYKAGDFAHVENVLESETRSRVHRRLEKTDETFSFSSEKQEETQRDTQTTDRFELKREAERIIKADLAVNVNANVTYSYGPIVANLTGGVAYTRSQTDQQKSADNFAQEVVEKAIKRVQSRASEQRTTTKIFETEETNTHAFVNPVGQGHISGIYRWLDKEYRAQLFNYGKRLMFEFVLPEPAAFLVESRLRAFEAQLEVPQPPPTLVPQNAPIVFAPAQIDEPTFNLLRLKYDLGDLSFPPQFKTVPLKDTKNDHAYFREVGMTQPGVPDMRSYACEIGAKGYAVIELMVDGAVGWSGVAQNPQLTPRAWERNLFSIALDGTKLFDGDFSIEGYHAFVSPNLNPLDNKLRSFTAYVVGDNVVQLTLGFQNAINVAVQISARLERTAAGLAAFQAEVFARVHNIDQAPFDALNEQARQTYQTELATYHNRLGELRATAINELLQGQSDAFNRQIIGNELKRLCLAMLTKELDDDATDDVLTDVDAMGTRTVIYKYPQLEVKELGAAASPTGADASFKVREREISYPAPNLPKTAYKARYIQFLEQAFEWQQLAYLFYPYFWATPPKWIELMSRQDRADPTLSAFLQAGSCKVLLAVTPAYDQAVLHYLATGQPWEGGPAPVIGDPLYVPIHEELRKQQDDLTGATPEGTSWKFTVPTSLVYLENSTTPLPKSVCNDA